MSKLISQEWQNNFRTAVAEGRRDNTYYWLMTRQDASLDLWAMYHNQKGVNNMLVAFMQSALEAAGIVVSIGVCFKAMQIALRSGNYKTPREAIDDQNTWATAVELQKQED